MLKLFLLELSNVEKQSKKVTSDKPLLEVGKDFTYRGDTIELVEYKGLFGLYQSATIKTLDVGESITFRNQTLHNRTYDKRKYLLLTEDELLNNNNNNNLTTYETNLHRDNEQSLQSFYNY